MSVAVQLELQSLQELVTVRDWVRFFVSEMNRCKVAFGHGSTNALDEAVYLVQSALHLPIQDISPFLDAHVTEAERQRMFDFLVKRTADREPASYITGEAWLIGERFIVDHRVIVPRSFIAELLADHLTPWLDYPDQELDVLDLCCGSGCLGILAAKMLPNAQVDCIDLSPEALEVAKLNVELHELNRRVNLIQSDLYSNVAGRTWDVILTNPPYVNEGSMQKLPQEYLREPRMALAGGDDGMDLIDTILSQAPHHLNDGGMLICELGNERDNFEARYPHLPALWVEVSAGEDQVFILRKEDLV